MNNVNKIESQQPIHRLKQAISSKKTKSHTYVHVPFHAIYEQNWEVEITFCILIKIHNAK